MDITTTNSLNKYFAVFLAVYPVLCIYKAYGNFTIGDVILMGFIIMAILRGVCFKNIVPMFIIYGLYIVISQQFDLILTDETDIALQMKAATIRALKLCFYVFAIICLAGSRVCDFYTLRHCMVLVGIITSFFLFYQYIMFLGFGKVVLGQIPGLEVYLKEYTASNFDYETTYSYTFRPCSIFLEPAMLAQYMIVPIAMLLFTNDFIKSKWLIISLFSLTIILSTSGQGILYLALTFAYFSVFYLKRKYIGFFFIAILLIIGFIGYQNVEPLRFAIDRLLFGEDAQDARLGTYSYCTSLEGWNMFFGKGYGCTPKGLYLAGAAYVWYGAGFVGLLIALMLYIQVFLKYKNAISRVLALIFFAMFWGTALFYNYMFFWFFAVIIAVSNPAIGKVNNDYTSSKHD